MKAGGKQDGDFRELSGSLASAFRLGFHMLSPFFCSTIFFLPRLRVPRLPMRLSQFMSAAAHQRCQWNVHPIKQPSRSVRGGFAVHKINKKQKRAAGMGGRVPLARANVHYTRVTARFIA
jgi:hypothetical protein